MSEPPAGTSRILDPDLPIIDSLHHLFIRPGVHYLVEDYLADARTGHRIEASIFMQAGSFLRADGPAELRGLGEVEFANGQGAMAASGQLGTVQACAAIVGQVDLRLGDAAARFLDAAMERAPDRFRGVRQGANHSDDPVLLRLMPAQPPAGLLADATFRAGFAHLASRGLSFDAAVFHPQLGELAALADAFPDTVIVLNHAGLALGVGRYADDRAAAFDAWRSGIEALSERANVCCRISGFGLPFWGFGLDRSNGQVGHQELAAAWQPYVEVVLAAFGADRCMMASNFPPDRAVADFATLWNALKYCVRDAGRSEKEAVFSATAARVYRLDFSPQHQE